MIASRATTLGAASARRAVLTIDLDAVVENYRRLRTTIGGVHLAAVVKANAYGLGLETLGATLFAAGCLEFFAGTFDEALIMREAAPDADVYVLHGLAGAWPSDFEEYGLIPVLNDLSEIDSYVAAARRSSHRLPAAIHLDTGLTRLGVPPPQAERLVAEPERLAGIDIRSWITHLACFDDAQNPMNAAQREKFAWYMARLPRARASLASSTGIFMGPEFHFDLVRPGSALYGINPTPITENPMREVVSVHAPILQLHEVEVGATVGYGATFTCERQTRIATVAAGYCDGFLRAASNRGVALVGGREVPIVGRLSMDLLTLDVTGVPDHFIEPGANVTLLGGALTAERVGSNAGTTPNELFTRLGGNLHRVVVPYKA